MDKLAQQFSDTHTVDDAVSVDYDVEYVLESLDAIVADIDGMDTELQQRVSTCHEMHTALESLSSIDNLPAVIAQMEGWGIEGFSCDLLTQDLNTANNRAISLEAFDTLKNFALAFSIGAIVAVIVKFIYNFISNNSERSKRMPSDKDIDKQIKKLRDWNVKVTSQLEGRRIYTVKELDKITKESSGTIERLAGKQHVMLDRYVIEGKVNPGIPFDIVNSITGSVESETRALQTVTNLIPALMTLVEGFEDRTKFDNMLADYTKIVDKTFEAVHPDVVVAMNMAGAFRAVEPIAATQGQQNSNQGQYQATNVNQLSTTAIQKYETVREALAAVQAPTVITVDEFLQAPTLSPADSSTFNSAKKKLAETQEDLADAVDDLKSMQESLDSKIGKAEEKLTKVDHTFFNNTVGAKALELTNFLKFIFTVTQAQASFAGLADRTLLSYQLTRRDVEFVKIHKNTLTAIAEEKSLSL